MSKRMEGAPGMPPQGNEWVSKEEFDELRDHTNSLETKVDNLSAQIAEMQKTQQLLLEKIGDIRKAGGEQKDSVPRDTLRSKLGAVATSAAAFFGKFFHRGEDLGDIPEKELGKRGNRGAHAKGKEKGDTPVVPTRKNEKSKISKEQEDKRNKGKRPMWQKVVAGLGIAAVAVSALAFTASPHKEIQDMPKDFTSGQTVDMNNLHMPEAEQALAEQDAEAAQQQQLAETMGMSVEDMHAIADRHGVNHNDIGTAKAHDQMRDNMESSYNLSEKIDLEDMSEVERSERSKQEILFANMNNKYVTAQISSARLGAHDASDSGLTQRLFSQYEENDAVWQEQAKENAKFLNESTYSTRLAGTDKTYTYGTENQWDGPIEKQYVLENSGGETVYIVEVTNGNIKMQFKDGCVQAVWFEEAVQPRQQAERRTVVQREVVQQEEHQEHHQENRQSRQYSWEREGGKEEHRQDDRKNPSKNDTQQEGAQNFEDNSKADNNAPTYDGQQNPDASTKSGNTDKDPNNGSEVVPGDRNGSIGGKQDAKPGQQDWGDGGGAADNGQDKTTANPSDQGGSGKDTAGGNQTDSGSGSKETAGGNQTTDSGSGSKETDRRSSSQHRSSHWQEGGSETTDENGNTTRKSYSSASDTGWVDDNDTHSGGNQTSDNVELQNIVVPGA